MKLVGVKLVGVLYSLTGAGVAGLGASNVHTHKLPQGGSAGKGIKQIIGHYRTKSGLHKQKINGLRALLGEIGGELTNLG